MYRRALGAAAASLADAGALPILSRRFDIHSGFPQIIGGLSRQVGIRAPLHKKKEALCLELGNKDSLQRSYGNQALILQDWGRLEEAMALLEKVEALSLELGTKDSLQTTYGNQALILQDWGRLVKAMALLKKQEALCLELDNNDSLQRSYGNQALIHQAWACSGR